MTFLYHLKLFTWFFTGFLESFLFLGFSYGFSFFEFILKDEGVFYSQSCSNGTGVSEIWSESSELCPEALELYNTLFTTIGMENKTYWKIIKVFIVILTPEKAAIGILGYFLSSFLIDFAGIFWFRMLFCSMNTAGYIMVAYYEENHLLLFPGLIFIAFSLAGIWLADGIASSIFGRYEGIVIVLLAGAYDASSGIPLILEKIYPTFSLSQMTIFLAILTAIMHIRTFLQMPYFLPNNSFDKGWKIK